MQDKTKILRKWLHFIASPAVGWVLRMSIVAILLWLLVWAVFGDSIAYIGYINAAAFFWGFGMVFFACLFALRLEVYWGLATLAIGIFILTFGNGLNVGQAFPDTSQKASGSTRLVSASLRGRNSDMAAAARRLVQYGPDIIAVQEVSDKMLLMQELEKASGFRWAMVSQGMLAVYSKTPVTKVAGGGLKNLLRADIGQGDNKISVWTLRAPKNYTKPIENTKFFVALEREMISAEPDIIMGDFNATQWNSGYSRVAKHMDNAQARTGFGQGSSFPADGRLSGMFGAYMRIDHIFLASRGTAVAAFTGEASSGADHHPVVADIDFASQF